MEDRAGTEHRPAGGARGAAEGVRTVAPSPLTEVTTLAVTLLPFKGDVPTYGFQVPIPGPTPWRLALATVTDREELEPA